MLPQGHVGQQSANFKRLKNEGSSTFNARADYDYTITLPNHTTMVAVGFISPLRAEGRFYGNGSFY
jgi:hypothetical protein